MYPEFSEYLDEQPDEKFTDFDDLLYQWKQYVNSELTEFKVIRSDMFGTGCVCDLKTIFETNNVEPEFVMSLMPRVTDCASECLYSEYSKLISNFLSRYLNQYGNPMTIADLGQEEVFFYNDFEKVARKKMIWNTWDLWRTDGVINTK
jgi:hypothetical protein